MILDAPGERWDKRTYEGEDFTEADLEELATLGCTFLDCTFTSANLSLSRHERSAFVACSFHGTRLSDASFIGCKLTGSTFLGAQLRGITIHGGDLSSVSFGGAVLREKDLSGVRLVEANLVDADLSGSSLAGADLRGLRIGNTTLRDVDLRGARLDGFDPRRADLRGARIDIEHAIAFAAVSVYGSVEPALFVAGQGAAAGHGPVLWQDGGS